MWHRVLLTGSPLEAATESLRLLTTLSMGLLQRASTVAGHVAAARAAGVPVRLAAVPVEIYSRKEGDQTVLYMNDAALASYREFDGSRPVQGVMEQRPPDAGADDPLEGESLLMRHQRFEVTT